MLKIVIVDDLSSERNRMHDYTTEYLKQRGLDAEISVFSNGAELLAHYPEGLDLLLLDIEMDHVDGLSAARKVRTFDTDVQILFVTKMIQCALEGYEVDAADFLVKPIRFPVFCTKLDRVLKKRNLLRPGQLLTVFNRTQFSCRIDELICIESSNKKTILHFLNGTSKYSSEASYVLEEKLQGQPFYRCHQAFLVNLNMIQSIGNSELTVPGMTIPISKHRRRDFLSALTLYRGKFL